MIITCSQCQAKFKLAPEQIKETGSKVRCSNCHHVFTVFRPSYVEEQIMDLPPLPLADDGAGADDEYDYDDQYDPPEDYRLHRREATDSASMKARRDRRRQLYSDLEESGEPEYDDDGLVDIYDDDNLLDENGRPPLRRASARVAEAEKTTAVARNKHDDEYDDNYDEYDEYEEDYDDDENYEDGEEAGYDEYDTPDAGGRGDSLGLSADPMDDEPSAFIDDDDHRLPGEYDQEAPTIRAAVTRASGRPPLPLIIALGVVGILMVAGVIFFANRPAPVVLSGGPAAEETEPPAQPGQPAVNSPAGGADAAGTEFITFADAENKQNHYMRTNKEAGKILIITGMVRNSYPEPRSFIRLRGHLLSADGANLADRFIYAGNILSEEELQTLPIREITSRLSIKGGQDGKNMNVAPGQEIPFMFVFANLPENVAEYRIDPDGSTPAR